MKRITKTYFSMEEFLKVIERSRYVNRADTGNWSGGRTVSESLRYMRYGEPQTSAVYKQAEELLSKVDSSFRDRERDEWMPSVCGAYPIVPDYLIGMPDSMRARKRIDSDISPIKLIMEPLVSAGVGQRELTARGAAITALAMRMSEERPVELYALGCMRNSSAHTDTSYMVRVDSQPVNMSQAIAVFASASFARQLSFIWTYAAADNYTTWIRWGLASQPGAVREKLIREEFELQPQDIVIQGGYLPDAQLMHDNPVEWVHRQLDKQRTIED